MTKGTITKVAGPLVIASGMRSANMYDVVRVSNQRLIGEIIEMHGDKASIQVYEETSGLGPGEEVVSTGAPLSVELGPGLIGSIFDGIQRPLKEIMKKAGDNLTRGVEVPALNRRPSGTLKLKQNLEILYKQEICWEPCRKPVLYSIVFWCQTG